MPDSSARATSQSPSASSNYSKPPPSTLKIYAPAAGTPAASFDPGLYSVHSNEISPPESPHTSDTPQYSSRPSSCDVSPITESPKDSINDFLRVHSQVSNIPVPLRSQKYEDLGNSPLEWRYREPSPPKRNSASTVLTNWDHFSVAPTTIATGKPSHTNSSAVQFELGGIARDDIAPLRFNAATIGGGGGRYPTNLSTRQPDPLVIPKEAWKGASGRHTIIYPLCDKPLPPGKTPSFPRGTQKAADRSRNKTWSKMTYRKPVRAPSPLTSDTSTGPNEGGGNSHLQLLSSLTAQIPMNFPGTPSVKSSPSLVIPSDIHDHHSSSSADNGIATRTSANGISFSPSRTITSSIPLAQMQLSPTILKNDHSSSSPKRNVTCKKHDQKPHLITPEITPMKMQGGRDLEAIENDFRAKMHNMHLWDQSPGRFSTTTCATTVYDSPPATPEMRSNSPTPTPPSTINRKRPIAASSLSNPKVASRKPTPQEFKKSSRVTPLNARLSKSLPKSPPEVQAVTRVASLEAKLENLRRRRSNLRTVIQERTNVVQLSSTVNSMTSRHEIKRTVDGLHEELAEVIKDEHETGLQLHRAWKRHDTDSAYEHSSLWVKRLAS